MELKILTPMENTLPEIKWNNVELKQAVTEKMKEYANIAYTEDDSKAMKADKATINKFIAAVEDERKRVKRYYMEPYERFESQAKEVLLPARDAVKVLDSKLMEIEQKYREEKLRKCMGFYKQYAGDLEAIIPFDKAMKEELYKRSFTDKKLEQAFIDFFDVRREEIKTIEEMDSKYKDKILLEYGRTLNLQSALREGKRLEELETVMKQRRQKQEEEERRSKEQTECSEQKLPAGQQTEANSPDPVQEKKAEPVLSVDFRVWGTREQLMALRQYMINIGLKFGKVE